MVKSFHDPYTASEHNRTIALRVEWLPCYTEATPAKNAWTLIESDPSTSKPPWKACGVHALQRGHKNLFELLPSLCPNLFLNNIHN